MADASELNDNLGDSYAARLPAKQDSAAARLLRGDTQSTTQVQAQPDQTIKIEHPSMAARVFSDVARGVSELPTQIVGGVRDAVQEALDSTYSLSQWLEENVLALGTVDNPKFVPGGEMPAQKPAEVTTPEVKPAESVTGNIGRKVTQFVAGFVPFMHVAKYAGVTNTITRAAVAGAATDAFVFDPHESRLSNLVEEVPALQNPVTDYLQAKPSDSEAEGRFKNALEGLGVGLAAEGFIRAVKGIRAARRVNGVDARPIATTDEELKILGDAKADLVSAQDAEEFLKIKGTPEGAAVNINLARMDTPDAIKEAIDKTSKVFEPTIQTARRGVQTHAETAKLAKQLNMTPEQLLKRRKGQAFKAEEAVAARELLAASADNLVELAKKASSASASQVDMFKFRRALSVHAGIQAEVSGATAEAGRALNSFNIPVGATKDKIAAIRAMMDTSGGMHVTQDMADKLARLDTPEGIAEFVNQASRAKTSDMVLEAWINGLLSGPQTHAVNTLSNALTALYQVPERMLASSIGKVMGTQHGVQQGEVIGQIFGLVQGAKDGLRASWKVLKTAEPSDAFGKVEARIQRAITAESVRNTSMGAAVNRVSGGALEAGGMMARAVDLMGEAIRIPGRLLMTEDEFFRAIGYRMELNAQAYRKAAQEGLTGKEMANRMREIMSNPPSEIQSAAFTAAHYNKFTKELGEFGKSMQKMAASHPAARVILPFIRTPINIMKFVGERTPLAPVSKAVRAEIAAGGARRDLALSKIALGSVVMAAVADMASSGIISGSGPLNRDLNQAWRRGGNQPYSIKIGDTWYAYNRLDPIGAMFGISADFSAISGELDSTEADDVAAAIVLAIQNNIVNKTYLQGLANAMEAVTQVSPELGAAKAQKFIATLGGTLVPTGVAQVERIVDPTLRDIGKDLGLVEAMIAQMQSRIPGYSESLPPRRNLWGEPIVLSGGFGPDFISPIYQSQEKDSPADNEILRLGVPISMPSRHVFGVQLNDAEYNRYIELVGKGVKQNGRTLKQEIEHKIKQPSYLRESDGPEGGKALILKAIVDGYKTLGKAKLLKEDDDLQLRIEEKHRMDAAALRPPRV